jgi:hypothetical protein
MMSEFLYEGDDGIGGDWSGGVDYRTYYEPSFSENPTGASFFLQPMDVRISQFENFLQSDEAKQFSPAQLKELENLVVGGIDPSQMQELVDQAEGDVKPGGIMSGNPFGTQTGGTKGQSFLDKLLSNKGLLQAGLGGLGALAAYKSAKDAQKQAAGAKFESRGPVTATRSAFKGTKYSAAGGGIGSLDMAQGGRALPPRYLDGHSDGMADKVPANIDGRQPAALSDGEFVIPADVVSHLGNGNSNAGAKRLYKMMDDIRAARTGNPKQGKQINPDKFMPR